MKKAPVIYKIYCPGCKNLWILKAPEEVNDTIYEAWLVTVNAEHAYLKDMKTIEDHNPKPKKWWEFWL
jgi:hypothetical protein